MWFSKSKAAKLLALAPIELDFLCRAGELRSKKYSVLVPSGWDNPKVRERIRGGLSNVHGW